MYTHLQNKFVLFNFYAFAVSCFFWLGSGGCSQVKEGSTTKNQVSYAQEHSKDNPPYTDAVDTPVLQHLPIFHSIEHKIGADILIRQGKTQKVEITGNSEDIQKIETSVHQGILSIQLKQEFRSHSNLRGINILITMQDIQNLSLFGSGSITGENHWKVNELTLRLTGSGNITGDIEGHQVKSILQGSGNIQLKGQAALQSIQIKGSGRCKAENLVTQSSKVHISGSGNVQLQAKESLRVNISGSGNVFYKGNPRVTQHISGSGSIHTMN